MTHQDARLPAPPPPVGLPWTASLSGAPDWTARGVPGARPPVGRVRTSGKFLEAGGTRLLVRGVTYGPFRPGPGGCEYHDPATVDRDFRAMAAHGLNAVRTYTVPPAWLLDAAAAHGLRVLVGLAWEQHVTFLDRRESRSGIARAVAAGARACAGHPALLGFAIGSEIPAPIVRWYGHGRIERFLERLYRTCKDQDPEALVTYVSYPTTEYLDLPFLDFVAFNVFLETEDRLAGYLARLQNLAGERPLLMTELGLDSLRHGEARQAETLSWQTRAAFEAGCAGVFLFSWTDEWHRGGHEITDWGFGLTDRARRPKPALAAVREAFARGPLGWLDPAPAISVVVCSWNGGRTIKECLAGLARLEYPDHEVIVVDDGSTDDTAAIAAAAGVRLIRIGNGGLSNARNVGLRAARGEIVAFLDDDTVPDRAWLTYLALAFRRAAHAGIGGPNLAPPGDGRVAESVAHAPGGPSHVLSSDCVAEHLPGCNMAFRRAALLEIGGFDPRFRIAADDIDVCWRLQDRGLTLGFSPGAVVWHHRRNSVRAYLRQQRNYGRAEGMLEAKWPARFNRLGHMRWAGQLYGKGHTWPVSPLGRRIDYGVWGSGPFQALYASQAGGLWSLTLTPEWYLVVLLLFGMTVLGLGARPVLWLAAPLAAAAVAVPLVQVVMSVRRARAHAPPRAAGRWRAALLTALLHVLQPLARLTGRVQGGLTPWRWHGAGGSEVPWPRSFRHWSERWRPQDEWLRSLEERLQACRVLVRRGGRFVRWDFQADCGLLGGVRLYSTVEEHGSGRQLVRVRARPRMTWTAMGGLLVLAGLGLAASLDGAPVATAVLLVAAAMVVAWSGRECGAAMYSCRVAVRDWQRDASRPGEGEGGTGTDPSESKGTAAPFTPGVMVG